jgi:hypothetical protein
MHGRNAELSLLLPLRSTAIWPMSCINNKASLLLLQLQLQPMHGHQQLHNLCGPAKLSPTAAHLAAQFAAKDAVHKGGGCQLRGRLGPDVLQERLMHGIQNAAQILMCVLLPAQAEPAAKRTVRLLKKETSHEPFTGDGAS